MAPESELRAALQRLSAASVTILGDLLPCACWGAAKCRRCTHLDELRDAMSVADHLLLLSPQPPTKTPEEIFACAVVCYLPGGLMRFESHWAAVEQIRHTTEARRIYRWSDPEFNYEDFMLADDTVVAQLQFSGYPASITGFEYIDNHGKGKNVPGGIKPAKP